MISITTKTQQGDLNNSFFIAEEHMRMVVLKRLPKPLTIRLNWKMPPIPPVT